MRIALVFTVYGAICYFSLRPLWQKGDRKGFVINLCLTAISFMLALLMSMDADIPSPSEPITQIVKTIIGE